MGHQVVAQPARRNMFKKYSESSVNVPGGLDKSSFQVIQCKRGKTQRKEVTKQTERCFEL